MKVKTISKCRPGRFFGCKDPLTAEQITAVIENLSWHEEQGITNLILPGKQEKGLPPNSVSAIANVMAHRDNKVFGLMHWREYDTICIRREVLKKVVEEGYFRIGKPYKDLVKALKSLGYKVIDIEVI